MLIIIAKKKKDAYNKGGIQCLLYSSVLNFFERTPLFLIISLIISMQFTVCMFFQQTCLSLIFFFKKSK